MRILILHPEGNYLSNPTISSILSLDEIHIDYFSRGYFLSDEGKWKIPFFNGNLYFYFFKFFIELLGLKMFFKPIIFYIRSKVNHRYDLVIGCDNQGCLEGYLINYYLHWNYGLLSFEIIKPIRTLFGQKLLSNAISLSSFLIIQDLHRYDLFKKTYNQEISNIFLLPNTFARVSDVRFTTKFKREDFGIPSEKKIIFYSGSIKKWTGLDDLISNISYLPPNYCVLIHGFESDFEDMKSYTNIYFTNLAKMSFDDLRGLVSICDFGFVWYVSDFTSKYLGWNVNPDYIGFSSGKFFLYLSCGIPILTNSKIVNSIDKNLSQFVEYSSDLQTTFLKLNTNHYDELKNKSMIINIFNNELAFENFSAELIKFLKLFSQSDIDRNN